MIERVQMKTKKLREILKKEEKATERRRLLFLVLIYDNYFLSFFFLSLPKSLISRFCTRRFGNCMGLLLAQESVIYQFLFMDRPIYQLLFLCYSSDKIFLTIFFMKKSVQFGWF